jgi:hypothetical protein
MHDRIVHARNPKGMLMEEDVEQVSVQVKDIFPLIQKAIEHERAFLADFAQDTIRVPRDLFEVLVAYQRMFSHEAA